VLACTSVLDAIVRSLSVVTVIEEMCIATSDVHAMRERNPCIERVKNTNPAVKGALPMQSVNDVIVCAKRKK